MTLNVATYSQILTILTQLATNYTNIFDVYYDMFYNPEPKDLMLQIYDKDGNLSEITVPNRAKDSSYLLNGDGNPNGVVAGNRGSLYQDITNGKVYINLDDTINGWSEVIARDTLNEFIIQGAGSPEGSITANRGVLYSDTENGVLYIKSTINGNTGWVLISVNGNFMANTDLSNLSTLGENHFVNKSLSNLNTTGENHFANPSLNNLNSTGEAHFDSRYERLSHKSTSITSSSTDTQYPSAKAVYTFAENNYAHKSLNNLNSTGEAHFDTRYEKLSNKVTSITSSSTDTQYPSAKAVYSHVNNNIIASNFNGSTNTYYIVTGLGNNKIIDQGGEAILVAGERDWTNPYLNSNVGVGGDTFGCEGSGDYGGANLYYMFNGDTTGGAAFNFWETLSTQTPWWFTFYNPVPIRVTSLKFQNYGSTVPAANYVPTSGTVKGSNDNTSWASLTPILSWTNSNTGADALWTIDLSSNTNSYKYYRVDITGSSGGNLIVRNCWISGKEGEAADNKIVFPYPFSNSNYTYSLSFDKGDNSNVSITSKGPNGMTITGSEASKVYWTAKGN